MSKKNKRPSDEVTIERLEPELDPRWLTPKYWADQSASEGRKEELDEAARRGVANVDPPDGDDFDDDEDDDDEDMFDDDDYDEDDEDDEEN